VSAEPLVEVVLSERVAFEVTNSMFVTIIIDLILLAIAFFATRNMQMVPRGFQNTIEAIIEALYKLFRGINAEHTPSTYPIVATIFLFAIISNWMGLLPGFGSIGFCRAGEYHAEVEAVRLASTAPVDGLFAPELLAAEEGESHYLGCQPQDSLIPLFRPPTTDLNNTIALAVIAFIWIEYLGFKTQGFRYLGKFFINPFGKLADGKGPIMTAVGLLELISEFARLPAFAFRLFGNIFAGEVLILVMIFLLPLGLPLPIYLFEIFVGFIQAFIFAVLTMAFVSIAVTSHEHDEHAEEKH
jgi:F-type H+-transporting ATPase subunit a